MNPDPPKAHTDFVGRYPKLAEAWDLIRTAEGKGPLDDRSTRLVKLAIAMGAMREGAVHSGVRKALAAGVGAGEIRQLVALCASTVGLPSAVALHTWVSDVLED